MKVFDRKKSSAMRNTTLEEISENYAELISPKRVSQDQSLLQNQRDLQTTKNSGNQHVLMA